MCGINGITEGNSIELVEKMNEVTARRGPDGSDTWVDDDVSLGHNLLSIMSEAPVTQPYEYGDIVMVFNGAIFNFQELGDGTEKSDTEVLAKGLATEGFEFLTKCRGMWAVAWYDKVKKTMTLARDHFGVKPLFYRKYGKGVQFSSSPMALKSSRKLDMFAFDIYRQFGYVPGYKTLIKFCYKVCPGEVVQFKYETGKIKRWNLWNYVQKFEPTTEYNVDEFLNGLKEAVEESYFGYRQRGVFLSGGLDSTSVAHYLNAENTFTSSYDQTKKASINSDAIAAKQFAQDRNYNHTDIKITQANFLESIDESVEALEMPVYNKSSPSYWYVNKKLKEAGTVVTYSGDGGDEMYCGYGTHDRYAATGTKDPYKAHYRSMAWKREPNNKVDEKAYVAYMKEWFPENLWGSDFLNNCLFLETLTRVPEDFLTRNDKFGAYFGMEGRFPLLNLKWFEYILSIPSSVKMKHGGEGKYIAREALKKVLPVYITNKDKTGWKIPHTEWHRNSKFRSKMSKIICEPVGNGIDKIVNWQAQVNGVKTFYAFAMFKRWVKKYGISV